MLIEGRRTAFRTVIAPDDVDEVLGWIDETFVRKVERIGQAIRGRCVIVRFSKQAKDSAESSQAESREGSMPIRLPADAVYQR